MAFAPATRYDGRTCQGVLIQVAEAIESGEYRSLRSACAASDISYTQVCYYTDRHEALGIDPLVINRLSMAIGSILDQATKELEDLAEGRHRFPTSDQEPGFVDTNVAVNRDKLRLFAAQWNTSRLFPKVMAGPQPEKGEKDSTVRIVVTGGLPDESPALPALPDSVD